jgi:hypothetical protein
VPGHLSAGESDNHIWLTFSQKAFIALGDGVETFALPAGVDDDNFDVVAVRPLGGQAFGTAFIAADDCGKMFLDVKFAQYVRKPVSLRRSSDDGFICLSTRTGLSDNCAIGTSSADQHTHDQHRIDDDTNQARIIAFCGPTMTM